MPNEAEWATRLPSGCRRVLDARGSRENVGDALPARISEFFSIAFESGAEAQAWPVPERASWNGFFDAILFGDVLEHLEDPSEALTLVRPWLAPEGRVIASMRNFGSAEVIGGLLHGRYDGVPRPGVPAIPRRFFTRRTIVDLFEACDYAIESIESARGGLSAPARALADKLRALPQASDDSDVREFVIIARV